jgi:DnaJ-class molecular chaperone
VNTDNVTRLEIIDHTECSRCGGDGVFGLETCDNCGGLGVPGRKVIFWDKHKSVKLDLQDKDRTLKVFIGVRND